LYGIFLLRVGARLVHHGPSRKARSDNGGNRVLAPEKQHAPVNGAVLFFEEF
jgi:hypothetical protein